MKKIFRSKKYLRMFILLGVSFIVLSAVAVGFAVNIIYSNVSTVTTLVNSESINNIPVKIKEASNAAVNHQCWDTIKSFSALSLWQTSASVLENYEVIRVACIPEITSEKLLAWIHFNPITKE